MTNEERIKNLEEIIRQLDPEVYEKMDKVMDEMKQEKTDSYNKELVKNGINLNNYIEELAKIDARLNNPNHYISTTDVSEKQEKLESAENTVQERINGLNKEIDPIDEKIEKYKNKVESEDEEIKTLNDKIKDLNSKASKTLVITEYDQIKGEIDKLNKSLHLHQIKRLNADNKIKELTNSKDQFQKRIENYEMRFNNLKEIMNTSNDEEINLSQRRMDEDAKSDIISNINALKSRNEFLRNELGLDSKEVNVDYSINSKTIGVGNSYNNVVNPDERKMDIPTEETSELEPTIENDSEPIDLENEPANESESAIENEPEPIVESNPAPSVYKLDEETLPFGYQKNSKNASQDDIKNDEEMLKNQKDFTEALLNLSLIGPSNYSNELEKRKYYKEILGNFLSFNYDDLNEEDKKQYCEALKAIGVESTEDLFNNLLPEDEINDYNESIKNADSFVVDNLVSSITDETNLDPDLPKQSYIDWYNANDLKISELEKSKDDTTIVPVIESEDEEKEKQSEEKMGVWTSIQWGTFKAHKILHFKNPHQSILEMVKDPEYIEEFKKWKKKAAVILATVAIGVTAGVVVASLNSKGEKEEVKDETVPDTSIVQEEPEEETTKKKPTPIIDGGGGGGEDPTPETLVDPPTVIPEYPPTVTPTKPTPETGATVDIPDGTTLDPGDGREPINNGTGDTITAPAPEERDGQDVEGVPVEEAKKDSEDIANELDRMEEEAAKAQTEAVAEVPIEAEDVSKTL